ncbi:MAG: IS4 family transposase, partial [Clostridiaceae bacterium]|nr:IS4 family transposase [Clostridiaceae bacterium]
IAIKLQLTISNVYSLASLLKRMCKKSLHDKRQRKTTLEILQEYFLLQNNFQNIA